MDALTFNGKCGFDEAKTEPMDFHIDDDRTIVYPYGMKLTAPLRMTHLEEMGSDVLELPLKVDIKAYTHIQCSSSRSRYSLRSEI